MKSNHKIVLANFCTHNVNEFNSFRCQSAGYLQLLENGKFDGIFPVIEKSGNFGIFFQKLGNFNDTIFFIF